MDLMKWLVFCVACLMLAVAAADSEGAEYDYQGQTYATVVAQGCYSTTGDYDYDGPDGPLPVQEDVPVTSCFTGDRSGMGRYKMTLKTSIGAWTRAWAMPWTCPHGKAPRPSAGWWCGPKAGILSWVPT